MSNPQPSALRTEPRTLRVPGTLELPKTAKDGMAGFLRSPQREHRELCSIFQKNLELGNYGSGRGKQNQDLSLVN